MKILVAHNYYQQPGGEDQVVRDETGLLEAHGHRVLRYTMHNDTIAGMNPVALAASTVWNQSVYRELRTHLRRERPWVAHFHNTFPLISPAAHHAAKAEGIPVVQTLHNYRLFCPNGLFFRRGRVCEDCLGRAVPWPGVLHACYRQSRTASGVTATMLTAHRGLDTWNRMVDVYVALTEFARQKFIQGGLPADRIVVKPNFVDPQPNVGEHRGGYALFVGRLSPEKGIATLLRAWERLGEKIPLKITGDGPLASAVAEAELRLPRVEWLKWRSRDEIDALMREAAVLVFPSECYEGGLPKTIIEAFAVGLPVVTTDLGAMSRLVTHGRTGLHYRPSDADNLAATMDGAWTHPQQLGELGREARREYERKYTAERNYQMLMETYELAAAQARRHGARPLVGRPSTGTTGGPTRTITAPVTTSGGSATSPGSKSTIQAGR